VADRVIGGRYLVGRKIAEGGMGTVFEATHMLSKKVVALKLLDPSVGRDETTRQRFLREVAAPAQIGHDGIVEIYDAGFDQGEGALFVAMELLSGMTLRDRLTRGAIPQSMVLDLFERLLEPLAAAHKAGIVHRDLKPENVFLHTKRDGTEIVKILDFGIARDLAGQDTVTQAGTAMGTPHYMSPEQAMSARDVTFSTDVWALGVMLYEALAGVPPFAGETIATIVVEICTKPHRPLSEVTFGLPPAISSLVDRCLDKNATRRPRDAGALLAELRAARGTVKAQTPTPTADLPVNKPPASVPSAASTQRGPVAPTAMMQSPGMVPATMASPLPIAPMTPGPITSPVPTPSVPTPSMPTPSMPTPSIATPAAVSSWSPPTGPTAPPAAVVPPSTRPAWLVPVAIVGALGCLGIVGLTVLFFGLAAIGYLVSGGPSDVDGELAYSDSLFGRGQFADTYDYSWSSGDHVVITLTSPDFDTYLVVRAPSGRELTNDDEGYGDLNSRIDMVAQESGDYHVIATSYRAQTIGRYHLSVHEP
jgi:serine/threonine-protein kinase